MIVHVCNKLIINHNNIIKPNQISSLQKNKFILKCDQLMQEMNKHVK